MPDIRFAEEDLLKVKNKQGVYAALRTTPTNITQDTQFLNELRKQLMRTIEVAFRAYAKKHKGCTPKIENESWKRFEKELRKRL